MSKNKVGRPAKDYKKMQFTLSTDISEALKRMSKEQGETMTRIIEIALTEHMDRAQVDPA